MQNMAGIVATPLHKKLDKSVTDFGFMQQGTPGQPGQPQSASLPIGAPSGTAAPMAAPPPGLTQPLQGAGLGGGPSTGTAQPPTLTPPPQFTPSLLPSGQNLTTTAMGPAQPAGPAQSPFYTPQERASIAATGAGQQAGEVTSATVAAHLAAYDKFIKEHPEIASQGPGAGPMAFLAAQGQVPYGMIAGQIPHILPGTLTRGSDLLAENPNLRTESGAPIDPNQMYQKGQSVLGGEFAILGGATQSTAMQGGIVQDATSPTGYSHAILDKAGNLTGKIPGAPPPSTVTGRAIQSIEKDQNGNDVLVTHTSTPFAAGTGPLRPPPQSGTATPIVTSSGGQLHQPISQAAKNNLYNIDSTLGLVQRVQPIVQQVVTDIGRGGNIWDAAQQRSAWHQYVSLGIDPSNVDPKSIAALLPNVDPRLAEIMPTLAMIKIVGGQAYQRGTRSFQYINQIQQHLPDPERDTPQLMLSKLQQMTPNLSGLRSAVYQSEGVGVGAGMPGPIEPPPSSGSGGVTYARDPQGKLHRAPAGTPLPQGWKAAQAPAQ